MQMKFSKFSTNYPPPLPQALPDPQTSDSTSIIHWLNGSCVMVAASGDQEPNGPLDGTGRSHRRPKLAHKLKCYWMTHVTTESLHFCEIDFSYCWCFASCTLPLVRCNKTRALSQWKPSVEPLKLGLTQELGNTEKVAHLQFKIVNSKSLISKQALRSPNVFPSTLYLWLLRPSAPVPVPADKTSASEQRCG